MSLDLRRRLFEELDQQVIIDPHTHINPHSPASVHLDDILGYHYYTELSHSSGMAREAIEAPGQSPREKVGLLMSQLGTIDNTIQYSWFVELSQKLFGFTGERVDMNNWEEVFDLAEEKMAAPDWSEQVLGMSKVESLFLTNDFDDPLEGFDTNTYIPCLRTDDLVFHLAKSEVRSRLESATGVELQDVGSLRLAIERLFRHFKIHGARACAISLPPDFAPTRVTTNRANVALDAVLRNGTDSFESHRRALGNYIFWTLAEMCERYKLPFDLMIGVNRNVYPAGVHQGRDLYDSRVSLLQYKELFNAFPQVTFPISVLASVTNQELVSYAWIFPNVVTNGHWWYSNTPTFIEHDLAARLEAVPRTKQIGYYSDAYKLEFIQPKFAMYKRNLAKILAERFVIDRNWSESRAVELGKQILRGNVESIFRMDEDPRSFEMPAELEYAPSHAGAFSAPITAGSEQYPSFDATSAAGIAAAGMGAAALGGLGGLAFGGVGHDETGYENVPLRPASDEFVLNPTSDDNFDVTLEPPVPTTPAESGFALDELDGPGNAEADIDLNELQSQLAEEPAAQLAEEPELELELGEIDDSEPEINVAAADSVDEFKSDDLDILEDMELSVDDPVDPPVAILPAAAEAPDELDNLESLAAAAIEAPNTANEEVESLDLDLDLGDLSDDAPVEAAADDMLPTLDLEMDEEVAAADAIDFDPSPESPGMIGPPPEAKPASNNPFDIDIPDPPKKKDDGGLNFDFLK